MGAIRTLILSRRSLALWLIALALAVKALVPAGYMVAPAASSLSLTFTLCSEQSGETMRVVLPIEQHKPAKSDSGERDSGCAYSALGHAAAPGADFALLIAAIAFVLALGTAPRALPALRRRAFLSPPLRGPPALA